MKKSISISVNEEKLSAIEMYLEQKSTTLAAELEKYAEEEIGIKDLNVQIACGYAEYDIKTDKNFEESRS